jgi:hypothetical protein
MKQAAQIGRPRSGLRKAEQATRQRGRGRACPMHVADEVMPSRIRDRRECVTGMGDSVLTSELQNSQECRVLSSAFCRRHLAAVRYVHDSLAGWARWDSGREDRCTEVRVMMPLFTATQRMYRIHSGTTQGLAPVNWPQFDWQGFQQVERSMIEFARECYCTYTFYSSGRRTK